MWGKLLWEGGKLALTSMLADKIKQSVNDMANAGAVGGDGVDLSGIMDTVSSLDSSSRQSARDRALEELMDGVDESNRDKAMALSDERLKQIEHKEPDVPGTLGNREMDDIADRAMEVTKDNPLTTIEARDIDKDGHKDLVVQEVIPNAPEDKGIDYADFEYVVGGLPEKTKGRKVKAAKEPEEPHGGALVPSNSGALVPLDSEDEEFEDVHGGALETTGDRSLAHTATDIFGSGPGGGKRDGLSEMNRQLAKTQMLEILGKGLGGVLGVLGSAGAVGANEIAHGQALGKAASDAVSGTISDATTAQRREMARAAMADEKLQADRSIDRIRKTPSDPRFGEYEKLRAIRDVQRSYSEESERIMRALGLFGQPGHLTVPSDRNVKDVRPSARQIVRMLRDKTLTLSDEDFKTFEEADPDEVARAYMAAGGPWSGHELQFLHDRAKENSGKDYEYDIADAGIWSPDTLNGYAKYIKNSVYTYKPEALAVDPTIDVNETHIGPMAQEIEKVVPAAVKETPDGVKTVNTDRLSLTNAGAVGDLARQNRMQGKAIAQLMQEVRDLKAAS